MDDCKKPVAPDREMPDKLQQLLDALPLEEPTRVVTSEDGECTLAEWQTDGQYWVVAQFE